MIIITIKRIYAYLVFILAIDVPALILALLVSSPSIEI